MASEQYQADRHERARTTHSADARPERPAPTLFLILLIAAPGCTMAVPKGVRKVDTAELQNIPTVVTAPAQARTAAATNATPTTRPRQRTNNE